MTRYRQQHTASETDAPPFPPPQAGEENPFGFVPRAALGPCGLPSFVGPELFSAWPSGAAGCALRADKKGSSARMHE
jgi:hypothetical protein